MTEEEAARKSRDVGPGEASRRVGIPRDEAGLTSEEREMLSTLSGGRRPGEDSVEKAEVSPRGSARGETPGTLTPEEAEMLAALSSETKAGTSAQALETPPTRQDAAATGLTPEEESLLDQARTETTRLTREELPAMFEEKGEERVPTPSSPVAETESPTPAPTLDPDRSGLRAEALDGIPDTPPATVIGPGESTLRRGLALPLDVINYPFRRMSPVWRMGLGFCGCLLLITLLLVILVRMLT